MPAGFPSAGVFGDCSVFSFFLRAVYEIPSPLRLEDCFLSFGDLPSRQPKSATFPSEDTRKKNKNIARPDERAGGAKKRMGQRQQKDVSHREKGASGDWKFRKDDENDNE
jgi:hypothetical protein